MTEAEHRRVDRSALEALRKRLLDLSGRSTLLNYKHQHKTHVRIVDELPAQLASLLLNGGELRLDPVPTPTLEQLVDAGYVELDPETKETRELKPPPTATDWGKRLGLDMSVELPTDSEAAREEARHTDDVAQTQYLPQELENRLSNLGRRARLSIQERGANVLYLALGFMEWMPEGETARSYHSPLFLLPVSLRQESARKRGSGRHPPYFVRWTEEELLPNLSLRERLRRDYGVALPELDASTDLESYLNRVECLAREIDESWKVRRFGTLGLFSFAKLLMYLDLDTARWPGESILEHGLLGKLIGTGVEDALAGQRLDEVYELEEQKEAHTDYPVVMPADPSQHSVIKDVVDSKSLVVQGPPGTGKSQTITNLIAAALASGKSVLFVAEKMAALDVVYRNLERAHLSEFALNLHNHTGNKRQAVDGLRSRLELEVRFDPRQFEREISRWEQRREVLTSHARRVNQQWRATDRTIHQLLTEAVACSDLLEPETAERARSLRFDAQASSDWLDERARAASALAVIWCELGEQAVAEPAWSGLHATDRGQANRERILTALSAWQDALGNLRELLPSLEMLPQAILTTPATFTLEQYCRDVQQIEAVSEEVIDDAVCSLGSASREQVEAFFADVEAVLDARTQLSSLVVPRILDEPPPSERFEEAGRKLSALRPQEIAEVSDLRREARVVEQLALEVSRAHEITLRACTLCGDEWQQQSGLTISGIRAAIRLARSLEALPDKAVELRSSEFEPARARAWLEDLRAALLELRQIETRIGSVVDAEQVYALEDLGKHMAVCASTPFWKRLGATFRESRRTLLALTRKGVRFSTMLRFAEEIEEYVEVRRAFGKRSEFGHLARVLEGSRTDEESIAALAAWYEQVDAEYGSGFGQSAALGAALKQLPVEKIREAKRLLEPIFEPLRALGSRLDALPARYPGQDWSDDRQLSGDGSILAELGSDLEMLAEISEETIRSQRTSFKEFDGALDALVSYCSCFHRIVTSGIDEGLFDGYLHVLDGDVDAAQSRLRRARQTETLVRAIQEAQSPGLTEHLLSNWCEESREKLLDTRDRLSQALRSTEACWNEFKNVGRVDPPGWSDQATLEQVESRNRRALQAVDELGKWIECNSISLPLVDDGLGSLVEHVRSSPAQWDLLPIATRLAILQQWTDEVMREEPELVHFSVAPHEQLRREFRQCDTQLQLLQQQRIAAELLESKVPPGISSTRVSELTDLALVRHEADKKQHHLPPRQLLKRAGDAIRGLAPCFMMSPMSVAQYLDPLGLSFDLLVMDEASQIRPEDALGAIVRARQLVVVGDSNQLPPTRFFDTLDNESEGDEEERTIAEDSESILDTCRTAFPSRSLMWHYRSRDASLIAFSNAYFYENKLTLFPSPFQSSLERGIRRHFVRDGVFRARRNSEEADAVARMVELHLLHRSSESLGVVAMNSEQRDAIEAAIYARAQENPQFLALLEEDAARTEELFVKNLETVQGDERDVIAISLTYGPERPGGLVPNRFGPVGQAMGWRRLNVLFTRARSRMHIFTSMRSSDVRPSSEEARGPVALRDFLKYTETGYLHGAPVDSGRPPDSEFEVSVANRLAQYGFEVRAQIGVKKYFLDLAVVDPDDPGRYLLGIECDGATYHSAKSARERDWLRQSILEDLGWNIFRIWSTDWFEDPDAVIERLIKHIEDLRRESRIREDRLQTWMPTQEGMPDEDSTPRTVNETAHDILLAVETDDGALVGTAATNLEDVESGEGGDPPIVDKREAHLSLREELQAFDINRIRPAFPDTPQHKRLLRDAMVEAIDRFRPIDRRDFAELPEYLRHSTSHEEAHRFLEEVLRVVERWGDR